MKIHKMGRGGFTLIELLVVVAIIGILASVVMVVLSSARTKGQDSAIKTQLTSLRTQAELYAAANSNSFNNLFTNNGAGGEWTSADTTVQEILTAINQQTTVHTAGSSASGWAAQAQLKEDSANYVCVDYTGIISTSTTAMLAGATSCPSGAGQGEEA